MIAPIRMIFNLLVVLALLAGSQATTAFAAGGGSGTLPSAMPGSDIDPSQLYRGGVAAFEAGEYSLAEQKLGTVLGVVRDDPDTNHYMGMTKVGLGKEAASVKYFERAIEGKPNFVAARQHYGGTLAGLNRVDEARDQRDALEAMLEACRSANCGAIRAGQIEKALFALESLIFQAEKGAALAPPAVPHAGPADRRPPWTVASADYASAVRHIHEGEYRAAVALLEQAANAAGPHADILNYLGFAHRRLGDMATARRYYVRALAIAPDHLGANEYLGELYLELGDVAGARRQLARLDALCVYGCPEHEDLARLIELKSAVRRAQAR